MSNRVIRADIVSSERVTSLHYETRWLYLALVLAADDYGLVHLSYGEIRRATPLDMWTREKVEAMLGELVDNKLIVTYDDGTGRRFGAITKWRSTVNSIKPKWPMPSWGMDHVMQPYGFKDARTRQGAALILKHLAIESVPPAVQLTATSPPPVTEGGRGKGEGKEITTLSDADLFNDASQQELPPSTKGSRLPRSWLPPHDWISWANSFSKDQRKPLYNDDILLIADSFRDYWTSKPGKDGLRLDWQATWRNWIRTHLSRLKLPSSAQPQQDFRDT